MEAILNSDGGHLQGGLHLLDSNSVPMEIPSEVVSICFCENQHFTLVSDLLIPKVVHEIEMIGKEFHPPLPLPGGRAVKFSEKAVSLRGVFDEAIP